ncbi:Outer membrane efflux protein [Gemmata sp. SH-PL17]|uniref:TolC family protein n=1 Tax=Gemmata sp. SH-PL17 TaxID=1630693 RepID=UPI00078C554A|nr:TolC family protein [Gemmata sp. SH-PL17]AMV25352.1 Outer membrane efflux protein [Gemmata sp. SH-PL17]
MDRVRLKMRLAVLGAGTALTVGCQSLDAPVPEQPAQRGPIYPGVPAPGASAARPAPAPRSEGTAVSVTASPVRPSPVVPAAATTSRVSKPPVQNARFEQPDALPAVPAPAAAAPSAPQAQHENTLDLGVALRLAGVENPTINLAQEVVREALANQLAARSLLLPDISAGTNLRLHRGAFLSASGLVRTVDLQSLYLGFGSGAIGSGPPVVPGVRMFAHLGDAVYEPLAARQRVAVRRSESQAIQNAILLDVAAGYLELVGAESRVDILRRGETDLGELTRLTAVHAKAGQYRASDAKRAETNLELLRRDLRRAEEDVAVASARLCRLLNLDPSVRLRTPGGSVQPIRLIPEDADQEPLIANALQSRPEVFARGAAVTEAQTRVRQEHVRPWLPTLSVGYSYGGSGGGSNLATSDFSPIRGRSDFDVLAVWSVQNLGFGNRARVRGADAALGARIAGYDLMTNQIRREVSEALANARAASTQIKTAEEALVIAEEGFKLEMERIKQAQGRPIEIIDSFRQLLESRQELLRAVVAFNVAQFRLFVAIGNTPQS